MAINFIWHPSLIKYIVSLVFLCHDIACVDYFAVQSRCLCYEFIQHYIEVILPMQSNGNGYDASCTLATMVAASCFSSFFIHRVSLSLLYICLHCFC